MSKNYTQVYSELQFGLVLRTWNELIFPKQIVLEKFSFSDMVVKQWLNLTFKVNQLRKMFCPCHFLINSIFVTFNLFTTSEPPKYSNSNSPNLFLWFFCLIKSRANRSGITKPFLNHNLIFFSNSLKLFVTESF